MSHTAIRQEITSLNAPIRSNAQAHLSSTFLKEGFEPSKRGADVGAGNAKVMELVEKLISGELIIPSIQRSFVWKKKQIPEFLDSIYKGYPIGSILIWETTKEPPLQLVNVIKQERKVPNADVLLDGQQRITSLTWVLNPELKVDGDFVDIRFDLQREIFMNPTKKESSLPHLIEVREIVKSKPEHVKLLSDAGYKPDHPLFANYLQTLTVINSAFQTFQVPVMTFGTDDYSVVADVFTRVNKGGVKLTNGDLINSAIASRWKSGLSQISEYKKKLASHSYDLGAETPLRLMSLIAGKGGKYIKLIEKDMDLERLERAWNLTEQALDKAIHFLKNDCKIPNSKLLKSLNIVVMPGYIFHNLQSKNLNLSPVQANLLKQWVYSVMAFSSYSSSIDGNLEAESKIVRENDLDDALVLLRKRAFGTFPIDGSLSVKALEDKGANSGFFNLLFISALSRDAKDWKDHLALASDEINPKFKIEYHHFFPQAYMRKRKVKKQDYNSISNFAFISAEVNKIISDRSPDDYIRDESLQISEERLTEQLLPIDVKLWKPENFQDFLAARAKLQVQELNQMLGLNANSDHLIELVEEDAEDEDEIQLLGPDLESSDSYDPNNS